MAKAVTGLENVRVPFEFTRGERNGEQASGTTGSGAWAATGGLAPVGSVFGPVGIFIGGFDGYVTGSRIGEFVWGGGKAIARTVATVAKEVWEAGRSVVRSLIPLTWFS